jgi:hypothetical protein
VAWNRSEEHIPLPDGTALDLEHDGSGGLGGIVFEKHEGLEVAVDYFRLDDAYRAPFAALSYEPDWQGMRLSAQLPVPRDRGGVSLYYKRAREADPPSADTQREQWELWGAAFDGRLAGELGAGAGWIDDRRWRSGDAAPLASRRQVLTASLHYGLGRFGVAELQYQRTTTEESAPGVRSESIADLYIVQTTLDF